MPTPSDEPEPAPAGAPSHAPTQAAADGPLVTTEPGASPPGSEPALPGLPVNRAHPFYLGFVGAIGVMVAVMLFGIIQQLASVLTLVAVSLFLAMGLDPLVQFLQRRGLSRGWAVSTVLLGVILVFVGFLAAVIPELVRQGSELIEKAPDLVEALLDLKWVEDLDREYEVISRLSEQLREQAASGETVAEVFGGVWGAGKAVLSGFFSGFTVLVLTLYFLISLRPFTEWMYRLAPASRRARVRSLGDQIIRGVGGYVAGQISVAAINAVCTYILLTILGIDFRLVLSITVGLFGLIPLVGATIGAVIVVLVALFDSVTLGLVTAGYYVIYQQVENYVIAPRIMARAVQVPGAVAVVAALAGGTLLGLLGALVAIPVAAGILLIIREVLLPRQERA